MSKLTPNPYRFKDYPTLGQEKPVQAEDISKEFKLDRTTAMSHYSRKRMYVEGVVIYAGHDMYGLPSLELSDSIDGPIDCLCVFNKYSEIDGIKEGDRVTVLANFIDSVPKYGPTFKKCEVVKVE